MEAFLASIIIFAGNFEPRGWAFCNGQLLSIAQNTALFSLLGTTFGGDGVTNFALPNLQGRVPLHPGQGPGLSPYSLGQSGGSENTSLLLANLPSHNHPYNAVSEAGNVASPAGAFLGNTGALDKEYVTSGTIVAMNANAIGNAGQSQPFNNVQPYLAINFIIALEGIYPSRN